MKKILCILSLSLLFFTGCGNMMNTPTAKVEEFLGKYQSMDSEVLAQLDSVISSDTSMNDEQKKEYRALMEKQYQNLSYKITNEEIEGDKAVVDAEIEVFDYATSIAESRKYYDENKDEFKDDAKATIDTDDDVNNDNDKDDADDTDDTTKQDTSEEEENKTTEKEDSKYIDYKIKQLKDVTDKVKYEITFNLTKENGKWKIEDISDIDRQKLHGLYED